MMIFNITCHDVYNYGASLQAYALQTYLKAQGANCTIIDYKPDYLCRNYNFWYLEESNRFYRLCKKSKFIHFLYSLRLAPITFKTWRRKKPFDLFKKNYLLCTHTYHSLEELQSQPPQGDVYVAGSDQIWNSNLPNGRDGAFYLDFGSPDVRRCSYAASIGVNEIPDDLKKRVRGYLSRFHAISVREHSAVSLIRDLGYNCVQVCDPVLLLTANQWRNIMNKEGSKKRYILVYDIFADDDKLRNAVIEQSRKFNLPIYSINDSHICKYADKNISNAGPLEFLWLIYNADLVLSNSFHATAFSVLFNKQFATFYKKSNSSRMKDFLSYLGLEGQYNPKTISSISDWKSVNLLLEEMKSRSESFIKKNIIK